MRSGRRKWYSGVLDIPEGRDGPVTITHLHEPAGKILHSGTVRTSLFGQGSQAIRFIGPTRWHQLAEDTHGVWMTDLPIEQRQADELVSYARGRVLVGGLGLGYAVLALAHKKLVREIVVVERSEHIIRLVWPHIVAAVEKVRPGLPISVVHANLFKYLKGIKKAWTFNWALFDIWQGDGEGIFHEMVAPLRRAAHGKVKTVVCWNEDVMRGQLAQGLDTRLRMLKLPFGEEERYGLTLDKLCDEKDRSIYTRWSVPFWQWYRENRDNLDDATIGSVAYTYAMTYGRPEHHEGRAVLRTHGKCPSDVEGASAPA